MKNAAAIFIVVIIAAIAGFDTILLIKGGTEASISHTMFVWSHKYPLFTFTMGFTMGHLFWRLRDTKASKEIAEFTKK
jgi:hypothetical protein